jgi:hypothetical protein
MDETSSRKAVPVPGHPGVFHASERVLNDLAFLALGGHRAQLAAPFQSPKASR